MKQKLLQITQKITTWHVSLFDYLTRKSKTSLFFKHSDIELWYVCSTSFPSINMQSATQIIISLGINEYLHY